MNPTDAMAAMQEAKKFQERHPKLVAFFQNEVIHGLQEGSVLSIGLVRPGEDKIETNIRVTREDMELIEKLKQVR